MTTERRKPQWTSLLVATRADIVAVDDADRQWAALLPDRVLVHLETLRRNDAEGTMPIDRLEHSLQCATRAYRDNRSDDYVVCALLHDIGDVLAPYDHAALAACLIKPFVSERLHWMIEHHALFQGYYYFHHLGRDRFARERYQDHPWYGDTVEFCEHFDQCSFDSSYSSKPLAFFRPALYSVLNLRRLRVQP